MADNAPPSPARRKAVALHYDGEAAPRVTAKGEGEVAERIVAVAREHGVPVEENALLSEALSSIELDREIPMELYQAVAQIIAFVINSGRERN